MTQKPISITVAMRMVHIKNIPHILVHGITLRGSEQANKDYIPIGDSSLIVSRSEWKIPNTDYYLGDYIPFYFGPRTPMLYEIQHGFNNVKRRNPEEIVYCIISLQDVIDKRLEGFFTDGHAKNVMTTFYHNSRLGDISQLVRREDVFEHNWGPQYDNTGETKRKKSAELLLKDNINPEYIKWFVVYNNQAKSTLINYGVEEKKILVKQDFYF